MSELADLRAEAAEALEQVWFIQSLEEGERTDITLSLRFHIRRDLFVQVFFGAKSASLYLALIEGGRRVFGIDREAGDWHVHPYEAEEKYEPLAEGLEPRPILTFMARVEELLVKKDIL